MLSADAPGVLRKRLRRAHLALKTLSVHQGFAAMASFYREERADDCDLEDDGDMLLVQWGAEVVAGHTPSFKVDMTRQFMSSEQDGEILQLSLTFSFPLDADLKKIKSGERWFATPDEAAELERFLASRKVFKDVAQRTDARVKITFEPT